MLKVLKTNHRSTPMLCCDICRSWIDDIGLAAAVYSYAEEGSASEVLLVHKGGCHDIAERRLSGANVAHWLELEKYLFQALHNAGLPPERFQKLSDDQDLLD